MFAGDRSAVGRVAGVDVDADLAVIAVDTGGAPAIAWADDADASVGAAVFALANPGGQLRVTFGLVSAVGRAFRGPRGRRIAGSIEHTAPRPGAPRAARWSMPPGGCSASTPTGWATASTWPCRPTPSCASALTPSAGARPPCGPGSGSASPPPGWPGSCAAPSACPSGTACWSGWSRTAARQTGPGCAPATWWSRPGPAGHRRRRAVRGPRPGRRGPDLTLRVVRGTDELTVTVAFGDTGAQRAGSARRRRARAAARLAAAWAPPRRRSGPAGGGGRGRPGPGGRPGAAGAVDAGAGGALAPPGTGP